MDQNCPFCRIVSGSIPSKVVYQDDIVMAILDINPAAKGHMLLVPKQHFSIMPMIPPHILSHMASKAHQITRATKKRLVMDRVTQFIANGGVAGQQSAHFLMHIIPSDNLRNFEAEHTHKADEEENARLHQYVHQKLAQKFQNQGKVQGARIQYPGFCVEIPQQTTTVGHVELKEATDHESFFTASSQTASALFELKGAHGTNIIIHDAQEKNAFVYARKQGDGLNFLWRPQKFEEYEMESIRKSLATACIGMDVPAIKAKKKHRSIDFISRKVRR